MATKARKWLASVWHRYGWASPADAVRAGITAQLVAIEARTLILMNAAELETKLTALGDQLTKVQTEITAEIQRLNDALSNVAIPPTAQLSLQRLQGIADALDQMHADAEVPTDPTEPTEPVDGDEDDGDDDLADEGNASGEIPSTETQEGDGQSRNTNR